MFKFISHRMTLAIASLSLLAACAAPQVSHPDYTAFKASKPKSILVLPPTNDSTDVNASLSVLSQMTLPLAESGYYVIPVGPMEETFKQNGLTLANDIQDLSPAKLHEIFGADAALYTKITRYGATYHVVDSTTVVSVTARLVDLQTGAVLWTGTASANNKENGNNGGGGLIGMLVTAAIQQIASHVADTAHDVAGVASQRLLFAGPPAGVLYGPRSPKYGTD